MKVINRGSSFSNKLIYDSRILKHFIIRYLQCVGHQTKDAIEYIPFAVAELQYRNFEASGGGSVIWRLRRLLSAMKLTLERKKACLGIDMLHDGRSQMGTWITSL